jgi:hypothetical protein
MKFLTITKEPITVPSKKIPVLILLLLTLPTFAFAGEISKAKKAERVIVIDFSSHAPETEPLNDGVDIVPVTKSKVVKRAFISGNINKDVAKEVQNPQPEKPFKPKLSFEQTLKLFQGEIESEIDSYIQDEES